MEIDHESLTAEHTLVAGPSEVMADAPPTKFRRFSTVPSSENLVALSQVEVYALPSSRPRCLVYLLDLYLSKLPAGAMDRDALYL